MEKQYFTVAEANRMIPVLEHSFSRMLQLNAQMRIVFAELEEDGNAPLREDFAIDPPGADRLTVERLATLKTLLEATRTEIKSLRSRGCVVKHIEDGLVDWYARRNGRDIFLCWKVGEKRVQHWHETDSGFAGRQPICRN